MKNFVINGLDIIKKLTDSKFEEEKKNLTPETGFNLVGIDYFGDK